MAKGISTLGDVLVNQLADGTDLNEVWAEIQEVFELYNRERSAVVQLLSYPTTLVADAVPQSISSDSFEEATEFGVPHAIQPPSDVLRLGYQFNDLDISLRATWNSSGRPRPNRCRLRSPGASKQTTSLLPGLLRRLFTPTTELNEWQHTCYPLWQATA